MPTYKDAEKEVLNFFKFTGKNPKRLGYDDNKVTSIFQTDDFVYVVRAYDWDNTDDILSVWIEHQATPTKYNKPFRIICLGDKVKQLEFGDTPFFGKNIDTKTQSIIDLMKSWNIEYVKFNDLK